MKIRIVAIAFLALAACGNDAGPSGQGTHRRSPAPAEAEAPAAAPAPPASVPLDTAAFNARCMEVAKEDTDPAVLAADQRTCDCLERTLKPADFDTLLSFTEIDRRLPDYTARLAALYQKYGMSDAEFIANIKRIQALGRTCLTQP